VSPVVVSFRPAMATMSPARASFDLLAGVRVHHQHAADALALFLDRVQDRVALLQTPE
jgi:hypothetical protein